MEITKGHSTQAQQDIETIALVLQGNTNAFQKLMDRYYDIIYYTLLKMVHNKTEAEELTLEAFSKAYQSLSTYSDKYAFSTWLFSIATNKGIDYLRRKRHNTVTIDEEYSDQYDSIVLSSDSTHHPDKLLIRQQASGELHALVDELKPFWQQLIDMRYFQELSYEEIAEILKMPLGTVKSQLYRAKQKLSTLAINTQLTDF